MPTEPTQQNSPQTDTKTGEGPVWSFLNQPFTLWLFSSLVLGLLAYLYANYSTCQTSLHADRERLSKIFSELTYRQADIRNRFPKTFADEKDIAKAKKVLDGSANYQFIAFKDVPTNELRWEMNNIAAKWGLEKEHIEGVQLIPIELMNDMADAIHIVEFFTIYYGANNVVKIGSEDENLQRLVTELSSK